MLRQTTVSGFVDEILSILHHLSVWSIDFWPGWSFLVLTRLTHWFSGLLMQLVFHLGKLWLSSTQLLENHQIGFLTVSRAHNDWKYRLDCILEHHRMFSFSCGKLWPWTLQLWGSWSWVPKFLQWGNARRSKQIYDNYFLYHCINFLSSLSQEIPELWREKEDLYCSLFLKSSFTAESRYTSAKVKYTHTRLILVGKLSLRLNFTHRCQCYFKNAYFLAG